MFATNDSPLAFALESEHGFLLESNEKAICVATLPRGAQVPFSVREHDGQLHVEAHPHITINKESVYDAYLQLTRTPNKEVFPLWIDPLDGEAKAVTYLSTASAQELDRCVARLSEALEAGWDTLTLFAAPGDDED